MPPQDIEDIYELSPVQEGMLFHSLRDPGSGIFFEQASYPLDGPIEVVALLRAWRKVLERHPILRTSFHWVGLSKPLQVVHRHAELPIDLIDWRILSDSEQQQKLESYLKEDRTKGFDLATTPLIRLAIIRRREHLHQIVLSLHHMLLDGWSNHILMQEVWALYDAYSAGRDGVDLPAVRPYGDFIGWLQQQDGSKAEEFWRSVLKGFAHPTRLGVERAPRNDSTHADPDEQSIRLSKRTTEELQEMARQHRLTVNTVVQGAWAILLSRYSGDDEVVFGAVSSGRPAELPGVEFMVGVFINVQPLRVPVLPDDALCDWLSDLQAQQLLARDYGYTSIANIQSWSGLPPGVPLFESIVVFENHPASLESENDASTLFSYSFEKTNYPLNLMVTPGANLHLDLVYSPERFERTAITRMLGHLRVILAGMAMDFHRAVGEIPLLTTSEKRQLLVDWNCTSSEYPSTIPIATLFEEQAKRTPDAPAFFFEGEALNYAELNRRSNQMAHYLRSIGAGPEVLAGICLERSFNFVIALLGVIKAGAAYVPLDPSYPQERLTYMLQDSGATILVTDTKSLPLFPELHIPAVLLDPEQCAVARQSDANPDRATDPQSLAYVIYTSGSTGRPKGAAVQHHQILNRLYWMWNAYPFEANEVCCQKTASSFVDSIWEILGPLLKGIPAVIVPNHVLRDSQALIALLGQYRVTRIWTVPSWLRSLLDAQKDLRLRLPSLRFWVATGEALPFDLWEQFHRQMSGCQIYNLYGTSEIWDATWFDPASAPAELVSHVPIGRPIGNVQAYILDSQMRLQPIGIPGELYIGGDGLARGYRNLPALTSERFLPHPFGKEGARLYKTGDLARYLPDGSIEFLGRADSQAKIRGFRIELEEIEAVIAAFPGVKRAAVVQDEKRPGDAQLTGYIVPHEQKEPNVAELSRFLRDKLPEYMTPSRFVLVDSLPLTPSGKLDRRSLRNLDHSAIDFSKAYLAPQTPLEKILAKMYAEVLHLDRVSITDNFFTDLRGHSLLATQLVSRIRENFDFELPVRTVFDKPTVHSLANTLLEDPCERARMQRTAELMLTLFEASDEEIEARAVRNGRVHNSAE